MVHIATNTFLAVALLASAGTGVVAMFSVHDDLLAFPQYEIKFRDQILSEDEASALLASAPTSSSSPIAPNAHPTPAAGQDGDGGQDAETYEMLRMGDRRYLCSVPVVKSAPPMNATEKELSRAAEEKELVRATTRGWELLSDLEGQCLYFSSGWWSYSYCHNHEVRQFHQKPPQSGAHTWPPAEDPATPSYVLGQVPPEVAKRNKEQRGEGTELQATGELRYLVQKLGGGTTCDLTGKGRKIEVQFHCNSQGSDSIGWIKEVSICCYLMVIYTPRLCNDAAFLPPREDRANSIFCREVVSAEQYAAEVERSNEVAQAESGDLKEQVLEVKTLGGIVLKGAGGEVYFDDDIELLIQQPL